MHFEKTVYIDVFKPNNQVTIDVRATTECLFLSLQHIPKGPRH